MKERKWEFVHGTNGGWWLRLSNTDDVLDYIKLTNDRYDGVLHKAIHGLLGEISVPERFKSLVEGDKDYVLMQAARGLARKNDTSLFSAFNSLQTELAMALCRDIYENNETFVNSVGGKTFSLDYNQFIWRSELVFPDYSISDIRIKRFENGRHFYAYVGDLLLRDGDRIKWNSYNQAYAFAVSIVGE